MIDWRTVLSIESPLCRTSLFSIALMPGGQVLYFAYMRDAHRRVDIKTEVLAPASAWFHLAFVLQPNKRIDIYINSAKVLSGKSEHSVFDPEPVEQPDRISSLHSVDVNLAETGCAWADKI